MQSLGHKLACLRGVNIMYADRMSRTSPTLVLGVGRICSFVSRNALDPTVGRLGRVHNDVAGGQIAKSMPGPRSSPSPDRAQIRCNGRACNHHLGGGEISGVHTQQTRKNASAESYS